MDKRSRRTGITQDRVIQELGKIGFSIITDYLKIENNQVEFFDTDSIQQDKLSAIAEIKETNNGISFKLHDKLKALELLGRHLGMFKDRVEISGQLDNNPFEGLTTEELKIMLQKL